MKFVSNKIALLFLVAATAAAPLQGGLHLKKVYDALPQVVKNYPAISVAAGLFAGNLAHGYYKQYRFDRFFENFAQQHLPPTNLRNQIEQHKQTIRNAIENPLAAYQYEGLAGLVPNNWIGTTMKWAFHLMGSSNGWVGTIKELPGIYIKTDLTRLTNAERMRQCIQDNNLDKLDVAKKYAHKIDGRWVLFAEAVKPKNPQDWESPLPLSKEEEAQCDILANKTGYSDWKFSKSMEIKNPITGQKMANLPITPNWLRDNQGKLVCFDTDNIAFIQGMRNVRYKEAFIRICISAGTILLTKPFLNHTKWYWRYLGRTCAALNTLAIMGNVYAMATIAKCPANSVLKDLQLQM